MNVVKFKVNTITCGSCVRLIEGALQNTLKLEAQQISLDVTNKTLQIRLPDGITVHDIISTIDDIGHEAVLYSEKPKKSHRAIIYYLMTGIVGTLTGATLMVIHSLPFLPFVFFPALCASIAIPGIFIGGFWIFKNAFNALFKQKNLTMDVLFALSLSIIVASTLASFFVPVLGLPMLCHTGLMIVGFRNLGKFLNEYIKAKVSKLSHTEIAFNKTYLLESGEQISLDNIKQKHLIHLSKNHFVPCDSVVTSGSALINEKNITGELVPVSKKVGDAIYSGTFVESGDITISAQKSYAESLYKINQSLIADAIKSKTDLQSTSNKIISIYLPTLLTVATIAAIIIGFIHPVNALVTFTGIIVGACPCVLGLIVPLCHKLAAANANKKNITIKNPEAIENLATADVFIFDKTGTLTDLTFENMILTNPKDDLDQIQSIILGLEQESSHPVAMLLKQSFDSVDAISLTNKTSNSFSRSGVFDGTRYHIGGSEMLTQLGLTSSVAATDNQSLVYLCTDNACIATIQLTEKIRPGSDVFIDDLMSLGKQIILLTGSQVEAATAISRKLGIHVVNALQKPTDKIELVNRLKSEHLTVCMIGDGNNDESAIAASDIGISFKNADTLAKNRAQILLPKHQPFHKLRFLFALSNAARRNIKQSIWLCLGFGVASLTVNLSCVGIMGFALNPAVMAGLMFIQVAAVLLNVYRFKLFQTKSNSFVRNTISQNTNVRNTRAVKLQKKSFARTLDHTQEKTSLIKENRNLSELHAKI